MCKMLETLWWILVIIGSFIAIVFSSLLIVGIVIIRIAFVLAVAALVFYAAYIFIVQPYFLN